MLVGYNHNIKHNGQMYHIQTEDSGIPAMCVTTLLFIAGTIIASKKSDYAELAKRDGYGKELLGLMQNQHKSLLIKLRDGFYDDKIAALSETAAGVTETESLEEALSILDVLNSLDGTALDDVISKPKKGGGISKAGSEKGFDEVILSYLKSEEEKQK